MTSGNRNCCFLTLFVYMPRPIQTLPLTLASKKTVEAVWGLCWHNEELDGYGPPQISQIMTKDKEVNNKGNTQQNQKEIATRKLRAMTLQTLLCSSVRFVYTNCRFICTTLWGFICSFVWNRVFTFRVVIHTPICCNFRNRVYKCARAVASSSQVMMQIAFPTPQESV